MSYWLITVGSTEFDTLFDVIDCERFYDIIYNQLKFDILYIQKGSSPHELNTIQELGKFRIMCFINSNFQLLANKNDKDLQIFDYDKNLDDFYQKSNLVISHWGAGTVTEVLSFGKPLICVVNDTLMDNHQTELAEKVVDFGCVSTTTTELLDVLEKVSVWYLKNL